MNYAEMINRNIEYSLAVEMSCEPAYTERIKSRAQLINESFVSDLAIANTTPIVAVRHDHVDAINYVMSMLKKPVKQNKLKFIFKNEKN